MNFCFLFLGVLPTLMSVSTPRVPGACRGQKGVSGPLELQLQTVGSWGLELGAVKEHPGFVTSALPLLLFIFKRVHVSLG